MLHFVQAVFIHAVDLMTSAAVSRDRQVKVPDHLSTWQVGTI